MFVLFKLLYVQVCSQIYCFDTNVILFSVFIYLLFR